MSSSVGETGPDPAFVAGVAALGLAIGVVAIVGAALAWRGQVAGRFAGLGFGVLAAFFSGAAVAQPLPDLPPALSVIVALAVFTGSLFVIGALLLAWRPRPRSPG